MTAPYRDSRGYVRSQLFSYWARRLPLPQQRAVGVALEGLERLNPTLFRALEDAHVRKVERPDWRDEQEAVDLVGQLIAAMRPERRKAAA